MKELLEAGVHIGHRIQRWNPKMKPFLYGVKQGVHIIDIIKTVRYLRRACQFLQSAGTLNKSLLFVGTKSTASDVIPLAARECSGFYIKKRWLGGFLTNWSTMRKCIQKLESLDRDLGIEVQTSDATPVASEGEGEQNENTSFNSQVTAASYSTDINTMAVWSNGDSQSLEGKKLAEANKTNMQNRDRLGGSIDFADESQSTELAGGTVALMWGEGQNASSATAQDMNVSLRDNTNSSHSQIRASLTKKELLSLKKQQTRLTKFFGGVRGMNERPDVLVIVGQNEEKNAVYESIKLKIANVTLIDTDCDPELADYPIPANDDSSPSISVILQKLVQAYKMPII
jgi:ribosomal protein S2